MCCIFVELARAREWDSVVTCHSGHHSAHTWNMYNHTIGKHKLRSLHKTAIPLVFIVLGCDWVSLSHDCHMITPQCVTMTGCGNFCMLGMSSGHIETFNVQSGLHRGEFGKPRG